MSMMQETVQRSGQPFPLSPVILAPYLSPDPQGEPSRPRHRAVSNTNTNTNARSPTSYILPASVLSRPTPAGILAILGDPQDTKKGKGKAPEGGEADEDDMRTRFILRHSLVWAVERGDASLITWLCSLDGPWGDILDEEVEALEDEDDGWGLVGMALSGSCGRQEREEGVRAIVSRWGLEVGARLGRTKSGWTPLHLAAIISTSPLISFLLTRGASTQAVTSRGFAPLDLVSGMSTRTDVVLLLEQMTEKPSSSIPALGKTGTESQAREAMLRRRRIHAEKRLLQDEKDAEKRAVEGGREAWLRHRAMAIGVEVELLLPPRRRNRRSADSGVAWLEDDEEEDWGSTDCSEGESSIGSPSPNDSMLVFSLSHLPHILDILITNYPPHCQPLSRRSLPANAIFLYARFAHYQCHETWLEILLESVVDRIESGVYAKTENLAYLALWAFNSTLLLHLISCDPPLAAACDEMGILTMLEELINAIHVFVIRTTERRIDALLDPALLDFATLDEINDVRFEGDWNLFGRPLTLRKKRDATPKASSIFFGGSAATPGSSPSPGIFDTLKEASSSPFKTPTRSQSIQNIGTPQSLRGSPSGSTPLIRDSSTEPAKITEILSGVLLILQLYEVNPAIVVQVFSQVFYWISSELFNRILARKQYLCRSKAIQIKMNITVLDDWVRLNGLPAKTASKHMEPVTQLLQWLQCLSQVTEFATLVGIMQNMGAINPVQMRKAVNDYKYEVGESRMTDECSQYLLQIYNDWEKRRKETVAKKMREASLTSSDAGTGGGGTIKGKVATDQDPSASSIDSLFDPSTSLADWSPASAPECMGELLDSRYMIPFFLPSNNSLLVAMPPLDIAYQMLSPLSPFLSDASPPTGSMSRPPSRASFSSARAMEWRKPGYAQLRQLPADFIPWLKDRETERRLKRDSRLSKVLQPAVHPPLGPSQKVNLPPNSNNRTTTKTSSQPYPLHSHDSKSISASVSYPAGAVAISGLPSPGLNTSSSLDELRASARSRISSSDFEPVKSPITVRQNSYELKARSPHTLPLRTHGSIPSTPPSSERKASLIGTGSPDPSSSMRRKRWWQLNGNGMGVDDERERIRREGSEDTITGHTDPPTR